MTFASFYIRHTFPQIVETCKDANHAKNGESIMRKNAFFTKPILSWHYFPFQFFLNLSVVLLAGFSSNVFGQVSIPLSDLKPELPKYTSFNIVEDKLFVGTTDGLLEMSIDDRQIDKVPNIEGNIRSLEAVDGHLFIVTTKGLYMVSKDGKDIDKVPNIEVDAGTVPIYTTVGEHLFVDTSDGLYRVSKDGKQIDKALDIKGEFNLIDQVDQQLFVGTSDGLYVIGKDGRQINKVPNIEGRINSIINSVGEYLFVRTDDGLFAVSKDSMQAKFLSKNTLLTPSRIMYFNLSC